MTPMLSGISFCRENKSQVSKCRLYLFCLHGVIALVLFFCHIKTGHGGERIAPLTHIVKWGDTLSGIALDREVSVEQLRRWNNLQSDKIFKGQHLVLWPHSPPACYMVKSGDTLSEIALRFGVSLSSLRRLNHISNKGRIYPGQELKLHSNDIVMDVPLAYIVRKGDTLWDIARIYGVGISDLKQINDLKNSRIIPGMRLRLTAVSEKTQPADEPFEYIVKRGDSLSEIAQRFNVGLNLLRQLNHLKGDPIDPGQNLQLRPSSLDEAVHIVRPGETLSSIALKYRIEVSELVRLNGIDGSEILVGQKLRLKATPAQTHIVERGDALWEIARAYGITVKRLRELNGLTSDQIYPGQELQLGRKQSFPLGTYTVKKGDYLGRVARLHQMSVSELKKANKLPTSVIYPGQKLKVNPILRQGREWTSIGEIGWDNLMKSLGGFKRIPAGNGPYYGWHPKATHQRHARYHEGPFISLRKSYRQAKRLWNAFDRKIAQMGRLSETLNGWHFVLDPGHGGLDPGAVVRNLDGNGNKIYVVEDEYVFDIALRVYVLLRLHGAEVTMTLLSPNHLIRQSNPPARTFVNEKNEVYNSAEFNRQNRRSSWPNGGRSGNLSHRVQISRKAFRKTPKNKRIFLSFHADIDHRAPEAPLVLYYENRKSGRLDSPSRNFSNSILSALGAGAYTRGQNLGVLRNNPAHVKVVLELRNLAYTDHAWALRFEQLRKRAAEKVVQGVLNYVRKQG